MIEGACVWYGARFTGKCYPRPLPWLGGQGGRRCIGDIGLRWHRKTAWKLNNALPSSAVNYTLSNTLLMIGL